WFCGFVSGQFAPPVGEEGTTAIAADDLLIKGWAIACEAERGPQDITMPELGLTTNGSIENIPGIADNLVISLGDGGVATVTFEHPITNGEGWDFAVFENGFDDVFLELAFVEVSSDGQHFFRFPATSLTDTTTQTATFGLTDATKINNLAGKYRGGYGTPFDLEELMEFSDQIDLDNITHVRVIDVVGSINPEWGSRDGFGSFVNDPFPTPFPVGGFDLDAVAVLNQNVDVGFSNLETANFTIEIYPNPVSSEEYLTIDYPEVVSCSEIQLSDVKIPSKI
ncbi:MAG: T9SS C-terminal target domain-containing protein, partial [Proteobacteria bacterium]|nr:T9SS C-terminal target domain-containing protein [Pseudomonadota bacterium]